MEEYRLNYGSDKEIHSFKEKEEYSHIEDELFNNLYRRVFPNIKDIKEVEYIEGTEGEKLQKQGIDKILYFRHGMTIKIEEKKRDKDRNDIAIEIWSSYQKQVPGWIYKLQSDYLVYAYMPSKRVHIIDIPSLKRAWATNEDEWMKYCERIAAINETYDTHSVAVTPEMLRKAKVGIMTTSLERKINVN